MLTGMIWRICVGESKFCNFDDEMCQLVRLGLEYDNNENIAINSRKLMIFYQYNPGEHKLDINSHKSKIF